MAKERQHQPTTDRQGSSSQSADGLSASGTETGHAGQRNPLLATDSLNLAELFEAQSGATPDAIALVEGKRELTYAELDRYAGHFADILLKTGAGPEQVFAILSPATIESIVAILGILKTGAAYLPLDPNQPDTRLASILGDACPSGIVAPEGVGRRLPEPLRSLSLAMPVLPIAPSAVSGGPARQGFPGPIAHLLFR